MRFFRSKLYFELASSKLYCEHAPLMSFLICSIVHHERRFDLARHLVPLFEIINISLVYMRL